MIRRYLPSVVLGGIVTFGLFFLMQSLIAYGSAGDQDEVVGTVIDFVMLDEESETQTKRRRAPRKVVEERPPEPPDMDIQRARMPQSQTNMSFGRFDFGDLAGGPHIGGAPTDGDVLPLVRIEPRYPARALQREIEGWVLLEFSITPAGTVVNPFVVDSEPPRTFDRAALRAVSRWKYKPKVEDGLAVTRHGVQVVLTFLLERD
ncbi:MAG: energy transducer TonB [Myxococcota bacterium]